MVKQLPWSKCIQECRQSGAVQFKHEKGISSVPVYDVYGLNGLNQIVGYCKNINQNYKILYRGTIELFNNTDPSIFRKKQSQALQKKAVDKLNEKINKAMTDAKFIKFIKIYPEEDTNLKWKIEAALQHYGMPTRCLDVVDNHWIALWFGFNRFVKSNTKIQNEIFATYVPRIRFESDGMHSTEYQYITLFAADASLDMRQEDSLVQAIDLRESLPSYFLRPHAQLAWILRKKKIKLPDKYGFNSAIVGILRMKTIDVFHWLGTGELLSYRNLFPSVREDQGYAVLLSRESGGGKDTSFLSRESGEGKDTSFLDKGDILRYD